ncbi:MAG: hypothetical protein AB1649_32420, partial [Chloroflexota bacterium]
SVFFAKFTAEFGLLFWVMVALCFPIPLLILAPRRTRTITGVVIASIAINVGMWLERFTVIVPSLTRPRLPYLAGSYQPSWVEWSITAACFAALALLYLVFAKLFPVLPIWEIREGEEKAAAPVGERAVPALKAEEA